MRKTHLEHTILHQQSSNAQQQTHAKHICAIHSTLHNWQVFPNDRNAKQKKNDVGGKCHQTLRFLPNKQRSISCISYDGQESKNFVQSIAWKKASSSNSSHYCLGAGAAQPPFLEELSQPWRWYSTLLKIFDMLKLDSFTHRCTHYTRF